MRRLIRHWQRFVAWWNRPVTVDYEPLPLEQQQTRADAWVAESERLRLTLDGSLTPPKPKSPTVQEQMTDIGNAVWPDWQPPIPRLPRHAQPTPTVAESVPPLPAAVQGAIPELAREAILADLDDRILGVRHLPLMASLDLTSTEWCGWHAAALRMLRAAITALAPERRTRLAAAHAADASLVIFAPAALCQQVALRGIVERHLLRVVASATGLATIDLLDADWVPTPVNVGRWQVAMWESVDWDEEVVA